MGKSLLIATTIVSFFFFGFGVAALVARPAGDAVQVYENQMQVYKDHLKDLRDLKQEFQTATPERKEEIRAQFTPLLQETGQIQKTLVPLAIDAFKAKDSQDEQLSVFLMSMLDKMVVTTEDYETAYLVAKAIDGVIPEQYSYLYAYSAYAAFNVMELDDAEAFYQKARKRRP